MQKGKWGNVHRFQGCLLPYPNKPTVEKITVFRVQDQSCQFKALPFGLSTAPMEFTVVIKGVQLMVQNKFIRIHQYLDNWLVRATSCQTYSDRSSLVSEIRLGSKYGEVRIGPQGDVRFHRLLVCSERAR